VSVSLTLGHLLCTRDMAGLLSMLLYSCASITLGRMHWESMYILIFMDNYGCAGHLEMVFLIFSYLFSSLTVLAALLRSLCWAVSHIFGIWFCNFGLPLNLSDVHSGQQRFSYREPLQNTIKFVLCCSRVQITGLQFSMRGAAPFINVFVILNNLIYALCTFCFILFSLSAVELSNFTLMYSLL
jgi:hypothetical protein